MVRKYEQLNRNELGQFNWIVGPVLAAWMADDDHAIILQTKGAWAVVKNGNYLGCCPTMLAAMRFIEKQP